ncbi:TRIO and F-actin-binding protein [Dissostichus eleginoides]|uniref:TRIO and F-actin-binding protein n=1 Tax=Dissostichus eleginoides TaxID=100907 RepID=A0AAD9ETR7_DISEL|nr:TRIO and F-actin-binding protein [Dissostichus eleginoides]
MPISNDEPFAPRVSAAEEAPQPKPNKETGIGAKTGAVTGIGSVKGVLLTPIASQAEERDTSSKEDSDSLSVVSSYCDVNGGRVGYGESSFCILSPDCDLYICDGDDDDSTTGRRTGCCRDYQDSVSAEDKYLPIRRRSTKLGMTRLDPPPHRPNPRAWMEEARSRDNFGSQSGFKEDGGKRESGYFSLGRATGVSSIRDHSPTSPYRHFERGHPLFSTRSIEPKDTIPFRNPNLGVASERQAPDTFNEDLDVEILPPDPYEIAVEVEAQVGPRSPSPTPFKIAESLASTGRKGFNSSYGRGNPSSQVSSYQQSGRFESSRPGSALQSRSSSPSRGNLPFRRSESTTSLSKHNFDGGGRSQGPEPGYRNTLQGTNGQRVESGTLPRNFKSFAGPVKSQSSTVSDFRSALRRTEGNGSLSGRGRDSLSSPPSRRDSKLSGQMSLRKPEMTSSSSQGRGRDSHNSSPSRRSSDAVRDSNKYSPPRKSNSSSSQSPLRKTESIMSLSGRSHHGRCGSPIREGYDIESQVLLRNSTAKNGLNEQEYESPVVSPTRRVYGTSPSALRKTDSSPAVGSRGRDSRCSSPGRRGNETPTQNQLKKTDTSSSLRGCSRESRNSSPSRRSYEAPSQSLLRKSEVNSPVKSRDSHTLLPSRKSYDPPDQPSLRKTETSSSLKSKNLISRNSSPTRIGNGDAPGYSILRNATNGDSSHSFQRKNTHHDSKSDSNPHHAPCRSRLIPSAAPLHLVLLLPPGGPQMAAEQLSSPWKNPRVPADPGLVDVALRIAVMRIAFMRIAFMRIAFMRIPVMRIVLMRIAVMRIVGMRIVVMRIAVMRIAFMRIPVMRIVIMRIAFMRIPVMRIVVMRIVVMRIAFMRISAMRIQLRRHTSSQSSVESSESGQMSTGSTGRNKEEYAMLADVPKVKMIHQREGPSHMVRPQTPQPSRRQELFKPASHSLSKHPSREWEETGESERDWHYGGSGYLSRAHSYTSLQRSGSPSADEGSSWKSNHNRSEQMQPDLLNFKKGWMSKLADSGEWKKHWFVLTDAGLKYYRDSSAEEKDELDGEIDLKSCVKVCEFDVEKNYGFQVQTRDSAHTLSAMTAGIRRNWIEVLKKCIRPSSSPDLTQLPDGSSDKENSHSRFLQSSRRPSSRHADPPSEAPPPAPPTHRRFDYVELSPVPVPAGQREAAEGQGREHSQWQEERNTSSQWEAVLSRKGTGAGSNQRLRTEDDVEKKWAEFERLPLKEMSSLPPMGTRPSSQSANEALQREVASLRQQLHLLAMDKAHHQALEELQRQHERQVKQLESEKERLLTEETRDTARVMEALKKKHRDELEREVERVKRLGSGGVDSHTLRAQQQSETQALQRELAGLSERYSQKCLEVNRSEQSSAEREREISRKERDMEQLRKENKDLKARLAEEMSRTRSSNTSQSSEDRTPCELEVLLRKRLASDRYTEMHKELSGMKGRSEREVQSLKEHLRLAMAALQEGQKLGNSLDH